MSWTKGSIIAISILWSVQALAEDYQLLEPESFLYVELKPEKGLFSKAAHQHVVRASQWSGTVSYDPASPERCQVTIQIPVDKLAVDEPVMRKRLAYEKAISDGDRTRVREAMLDEDQLALAKFAKISFVSSGCKKISDAKVEVTGDLEVHGMKKRITVPMDIQIAGGKLKAKGKFELTHQDFGIAPYSAALGAIKNDPSLVFNVRAVGAVRK